MSIDFKEFRKKLIDDELTMKGWCEKNKFDRDRLMNIKNGIVKATEEEIKMINNYAESEGGDE